MAERKSFILYLNSIEQWEMLSNEQSGILIKALLQYCKTGEKLETSDGMLKMAFSFLAGQIERDGLKFDETCEKRRQAINKRWSKNKNSSDTNECKCIQKNTNDSDNDNDNVNENDNDNDNVNENDNDNDNESDNDNDNDNNIRTGSTHSRHSNVFIKPSLAEVKAYCEERSNNIDPNRFIDYYDANGWTIHGSPMKDWKAVIRRWEKTGLDKKPGVDVTKYEQFINKF